MWQTKRFRPVSLCTETQGTHCHYQVPMGSNEFPKHSPCFLACSHWRPKGTSTEGSRAWVHSSTRTRWKPPPRDGNIMEHLAVSDLFRFARILFWLVLTSYGYACDFVHLPKQTSLTSLNMWGLWAAIHLLRFVGHLEQPALLLVKTSMPLPMQVATTIFASSKHPTQQHSCIWHLHVALSQNISEWYTVYPKFIAS